MTTLYPSPDDLKIRWERIQSALQQEQLDACLIASPVNLYYLTGHIFNGYAYLPQDGEPFFFVRRPADLTEKNTFSIRKPEDIPTLLKEQGIAIAKTIGLELDTLTYNEAQRLNVAFAVTAPGNASTLFRRIRMIKTPWEVEQMRQSGKKHVEVYKQIPHLFKEGMRDIDLQIAIENEMRKQGSLGIFRTFGSNMEVFMGTILTGNNTETPSPYDFSLGGKGMHPALPIGASGATITQGTTVMVDMSGNYTAYISDITRVYAWGELPDEAYRAHQVSIEMHNYFRRTAKEGASCSELYKHTLAMAEEAGLSNYFMGTKLQAKFVGHGAGLEINEPPVLMSRSNDLLQENMIIAFEPKFVLPGVGGLGIENTYLINKQGVENLTEMEETIIRL